VAKVRQFSPESATQSLFPRPGRRPDNRDPRITRIRVCFESLMNKSELIEGIATKAGVTRVVATSLLDATLETITEALAKGDTIALVGFGTFKVGDRAARTGKNPATGEALEIPAAKVAKFTPGKALKDAVNK
jgi:DNA-binding protein HU-beta